MTKPSTGPDGKSRPVANWLGHLVAVRRSQNFIESTPQMRVEDAARHRGEVDAAVVDVIAARVDPAVLDPALIRAFLTRFGPWEPLRVAELVDAFLRLHPPDSHVQHKLSPNPQSYVSKATLRSRASPFARPSPTTRCLTPAHNARCSKASDCGPSCMEWR